MRWLTRLTAGVVILIVVAGVALLIRARVPTTTVHGHFRTYALFRDASRLPVGSPVVIAGVQVGVIEKLTIEGGLGRIDMRLRDDLDLPAESFATRRADSLFGDSYVEIIPMDGTQRRLRSGEPIPHVIEGSSADTILRGMAAAFPKIDNALEVVHDTAIEGRKWVGGPVVDRLERTDDWLADNHFEAPIASAHSAMTRLDELTERGADAVAKASPDVTSALDRIDRTVAGARDRMRGVKDGVVQALRDTRDGLDRIDPQIAQAGEIMAAINEGRGDDWRGTLGRAVNDPEVGDQLDEITGSAREAVAGLNGFRSWLGMRLEFDVFSRATRLYAVAEIRVRHDKFYLAEFERGPLGGIPNDQLSEVVGDSAYLRQQEIHDRIRFTAQFGKQLGRFAVRGGIKDSTFGAGVDALFLDGRLKMSADVYGAFQATPRLKLAGALAVFHSLYVLAGVDDALNPPGYLSVITGNPGAPKALTTVRHGRDYFVGTMLMFTDDELAVMLRVYGALLVGLLALR